MLSALFGTNSGGVELDSVHPEIQVQSADTRYTLARVASSCVQGRAWFADRADESMPERKCKNVRVEWKII